MSKILIMNDNCLAYILNYLLFRFLKLSLLIFLTSYLFFFLIISVFLNKLCVNVDLGKVFIQSYIFGSLALRITLTSRHRQTIYKELKL